MTLPVKSKEFTCFANPSSNRVSECSSLQKFALLHPLSGIYSNLENTVLNELHVLKSLGTAGTQSVALQNV